MVAEQQTKESVATTHAAPQQHADTKWSTKGVVSTAAMLLFGTATAVLTKAAYELEAVGRYGIVEHFEKPWALTAVMFLGMSLCLPVAYYQKLQDQDEHQRHMHAGPLQQPVLSRVFDAAEMRDAMMLSIPAALDLVATVLMYVGLISVTASVYQMLRGAMLVFAALFGTIFLKRQLNGLHYGGIVGTLVGIAIVGAASLLSGEGSATRDVPQAEMIAGLLACIAGQCMQAAQVTVEDHLLSQHKINPLKVVGYEGLLGGIATVAIVMPLLAITPGSHDIKGLYEDSIDTLVMIQNSPTIAAVLMADLVAFCGLNLSGMVVIQELGAVYKTVLETARTLFVWLVGLGLYYSALGGGLVGESWHDYSGIQMVGFAVLVMGTVLYGRGNTRRVTEQEQQIAALEEALLVGHAEPTAPMQEDHTDGSSSNDDDPSAPPPAMLTPPPASTPTLHLEPTPLASEAQPSTPPSTPPSPPLSPQPPVQQEGPTWADAPTVVVPAMVAAPVVARTSTAAQQGVPAATTVDGVEMGVLRSGTSWASRAAGGQQPVLRQRRAPGGAQGALVMRRPMGAGALRGCGRGGRRGGVSAMRMVLR